MKYALAILVMAAACKHAPTTPAGGGDGSGSAVTTPPPKAKTPYETRRAATCKTVGPKMTACALADAKKDLAAGKVTQKQFDEDTKPEYLQKNTDGVIAACEKITTTFQLRVFEVCQEKETECDPLNECLSHVNDTPPAK